MSVQGCMINTLPNHHHTHAQPHDGGAAVAYAGGKARGGVKKTTCSSLETLNLADNRLGAEFGLAAARVLGENRTLRKLCLMTNRIGREAGTAIGKMLHQNMTLALLDMRENWSHDDGREVVTIGNALEENALTGAAAKFGFGNKSPAEMERTSEAAPRLIC